MKSKDEIAKLKKLTKLVVEWTTTGGDKYRMLSRGKHSTGYDDVTIVEMEESDGLGNPCWSLVSSWENDNCRNGDDTNCIVRLLAELVKKLAPVQDSESTKLRL